jgi:hypothetical protein
MFLAGVHWAYFVGVIAAGVGAVSAVLASRGTAWQLLEDYQYRRIDTFLDPSQDPLGAGYHITQSQIALGSGGWTGRGFMEGTQSRLNFLPEKHTDFIFTTLAEELGFVGAASLLVLYLLILVFCIYTAITARDRYRVAAGHGDRGGVLPVLRGQHGDGDGSRAGRGRAAAAGQLRRLGNARADGGLRSGAVGPRPSPALRLDGATPRC